MPAFQDIQLVPGVNTQFTLEANKAGISVTQLMRYKTGLLEKIGGWTQFYPNPVSSSPIRDIHAFQGLLGNKVLATASAIISGAPNGVSIISSGVLSDITPQINTTSQLLSSNFATLSVSSGSNVITVKDLGSSAGQFSGVHFDIPTAISNLLLFGTYPINTAIDQNTYTILSSQAAAATVSSQSIVSGSLQLAATAGSATIDAFLSNNQFLKIQGLFYGLISSNIGFGIGGLTLSGPFEISSIIDSTHFQFIASNQATVTSSQQSFPASQLTYYICQGPPAQSAPYGSSNYGSGPYGIGVPAGQGSGTTVASSDWLLDNWGEVLVAFQKNGPIFVWAPEFGFSQMQAIYSGPRYNISGFVSQPQQILFALGSEQYDGQRFTGAQDPLIVRWSAALDYTIWNPTPQNTAGSFHIPTGSIIVGGIQSPLYAVIWTDIDVWTATWAGQPLIWSWVRAGTGCGLIGEHAMDVAQGVTYWCSFNNLFNIGPSGVQVMPCTVWDFIFQNIDTINQTKIRAASNSQFSEISWFFPLSVSACSAMGVTYTGENNAYIKLHIGEGNEYEWDYGILSRTAWVDTTVVGPPVGSDNMGNLLQHETGLYNASGSPIDAYLETGYFYMGDGTDLAIVDWVIPDIRWQAGTGKTSPGTLLFTFFTTDYPAPSAPGESGVRPGERVYGPFMVTQATQFINTRMRGRFWRCRIESNDVGTFWRIGNIKFRWGPSGRR